MADFKKYRINSETLLYEIERVSMKSRFLKFMVFLVASLCLSFVYVWVASECFGMELPKTVILRKINARWVSRTEVMQRQLDSYEATLEGLSLRDNEIYRNIFGLNEIPAYERNSGFEGDNRYDYLDAVGGNSPLKPAVMRVDRLMKKSFVQSRSFDDIEAISKQAGNMASCIPAIPPICPDKSRYRLSSSFGYRSDPITGRSKMHTGFDFACKPGNPVYAVGDGVVKKVSFELFGYGNSVVIDHGFGYQTNYAHLKDVFVVEGMSLKRGECLGTTGNSGRSTGPHLHYEVIYRGKFVNPYNYFDLEMPVKEFQTMVARAAAESSNVLTPRSRPGKKK